MKGRRFFIMASFELNSHLHGPSFPSYRVTLSFGCNTMTDKIPCKECGTEILPTTAKSTGGLCRPCDQGTRESIEKSKKYYKKQKEYDPHRELWISLVKRTHREDGGFDRDGFDRLSPNEKLYYSVTVLDGEVYNGGMHQFFSNSSGSLFKEVVKGLEILGFKHTLDLLLEAKEILFGEIEPPDDNTERYDVMRQYPEEDDASIPKWSFDLERINKAYWDSKEKIAERVILFAVEKGLIEPFEKKSEPPA